MRTILTFIGMLVVALTIIGSAVPGLQFHVFFGDTKSALDYHEQAALRMLKELER